MLDLPVEEKTGRRLDVVSFHDSPEVNFLANTGRVNSGKLSIANINSCDRIFLTIRLAEVELEIDVDIEKKILYYIGMRYNISINDIY